MIEQGTERPAFGALLRKRRIAARLSQEQLAERAQISVQAVSALERGARRSPRADTLALLIRTLALDAAGIAEFEATAKASMPAKVRHDVAPREPGTPRSLAALRPVSQTSFIGRDGERSEIVRALATGRCVTLWGPGGVGKTRLAIESLAPLAATFGDRIAFVSLAPATDAESVVRAISASYDLVDSDIPSLLTHLAARSTTSRALLVIDNCEQVIEHVSRFAARALAHVPDLSILATSREPLRVEGECVVRIGPLGVPAPGASGDDVASLDAVRLFLDRAAASSGTPLSSDGDLERVATICQRLDGLPLAIELAAARTRSMSVRKIERALDERFALLTRGNRGLDPRQQTLRDTINWSYRLLSPDHRVVFERLALLNGRFAIEEAVAIAEDESIRRWAVVDAVADLVDKALVGFATQHDEEDRDRPYTMLESTRVYAASLSADERADGDRDGAQRRFGSWLLERAREAFDSHFRQTEVNLGSIDIGHLRGYLRWAIDGGGDVHTAALIVGTLMHWWSACGLVSEGLRWAEAAIAKLGSEPDDLRARATALLGKTSLLRNASLNDDANAPALEAHACALRIVPTGDVGDRRLLARSAFYASDAAAYLGRPEEAEALIRLSIETYGELGDVLSQMLALGQRARIASQAGDFAQSRRYYAEAAEYLEAHGFRLLAAHQRVNVAELDYALGNVAAAVEGARYVAAVVLEHSPSYFIASTHTNLAAYLHDGGTVDEAADAAGAALDIAREAGLDMLAAWAYQSSAIVGLQRDRDAADAAAIYGFTLNRIDKYTLAFTERRRQARLETLLHERLSGEAFEAAVRRGRGLSEADVFRLARAALA